MKRIYYVAGPFRGATAWVVERNIRSAEAVGFGLAQMGHIPLIPHTMYRFWDGTLDDEFWLSCGLELLKLCSGLVLCPGWEASSGTLAELQQARRMGMPVFRWVDGEPVLFGDAEVF